jgi:hypothetical protein
MGMTGCLSKEKSDDVSEIYYGAHWGAFFYSINATAWVPKEREAHGASWPWRLRGSGIFHYSMKQ